MPDGLLHTTIWEGFVQNWLEKAKCFQKDLAGDWINHLSIYRCLSWAYVNHPESVPFSIFFSTQSQLANHNPWQSRSGEEQKPSYLSCLRHTAMPTKTSSLTGPWPTGVQLQVNSWDLGKIQLPRKLHQFYSSAAALRCIFTLKNLIFMPKQGKEQQTGDCFPKVLKSTEMVVRAYRNMLRPFFLSDTNSHTWACLLAQWYRVACC